MEPACKAGGSALREAVGKTRSGPEWSGALFSWYRVFAGPGGRRL